jgi:hypothetical protein
MPQASAWEVFFPDGSTRRLAFVEEFALMAATDTQLFGLLYDENDVPTVAAGAWPN